MRVWEKIMTFMHGTLQQWKAFLLINILWPFKLLCIGNIWSWFIIHMSAGIFDILLFSLPGQKWSWWTSDGTDSVGRSRSPHGRHWPHESGSSSKYFPEILDSDIDAFVKLKFVWAIEVLGVCHALEPRLQEQVHVNTLASGISLYFY